MVNDYEWTTETSVSGVAGVTPEQWLRAIWEGGPKLLRVVLPVAWKFGLGLRLGSTGDTTRILGWRIVATNPNRVTVAADSRLMVAENTVTVDDGTLQWRTNVNYTNFVGRAMWIPGRVIHQLLVPPTMRRAVHRRRERQE